MKKLSGSGMTGKERRGKGGDSYRAAVFLRVQPGITTNSSPLSIINIVIIFHSHHVLQSLKAMIKKQYLIKKAC